jgi:precorrin-6A/cobalt-precorrin-6A reductase
MRVLILGGTSEASALARLLAGRPDIEAVLSLAGRTAKPAPAPIAMRVGGFGGADGLARHLAEARVDAVVDATHPFAARMPHNAALACARLSLPLVALTRPPWTPIAGDRWIDAVDIAGAIAALGEAPRRVFLSVGRQSVPAFAAAPRHHYLIRAIERPDGLDALPCHELLLARPPFAAEDEERLMRAHRIDILVSKNSGGGATHGKIEAARRLHLPVVMIRRPARPDVPMLHDAAAVLGWLDAHRPPP